MSEPENSVHMKYLKEALTRLSDALDSFEQAFHDFTHETNVRWLGFETRMTALETRFAERWGSHEKVEQTVEKVEKREHEIFWNRRQWLTTVIFSLLSAVIAVASVIIGLRFK